MTEMKTRSHIIRLVLLAIAVVAMLLLIGGLSGVELEPGLPFARIWQFLVDQFSTSGLTGPAPVPAGSSEALVDVFRTIFIIALICFPIAVILVLIDPDLRKRVLRTMLTTALLFIVLSLFLQRQANELETEGEPFNIGQPGEGLGAVEPLPFDEFSPERVPPWVAWGLSLALGLVVAVIVYRIVDHIRRNRAEAGLPLDQIAQQARSAIAEIEQGGDLRNTILRCYAEMSRTVREQRGLRRGATVTAREFTDNLIRADLPREPVQRLTRLFERARYGTGAPTREEEEEALASLQAIVDACQEGV